MMSAKQAVGGARTAKCEDGRIETGRVAGYHGRDQWA